MHSLAQLSTKEACTSRGAQAHNVPFCLFCVSLHYLMECSLPQGSSINLIVSRPRSRRRM